MKSNSLRVNTIDEKALRELDMLSIRFKNDNLMADSVIDVIGVLSGVKPSALIDDGAISNDLLDRLGLAYTTSKVKNTVYVSPQKETAERLAALHEKVWGKNAQFPDENREIGRLLGYPETSTEYFLARLPVFGTPEELPMIKVKRTMHTVSGCFQSFILSPDHYEEELASYSDPLEAATRELAPRTYRMLVRRIATERYMALFRRFIDKDSSHPDASIRVV